MSDNLSVRVGEHTLRTWKASTKKEKKEPKHKNSGLSRKRVLKKKEVRARWSTIERERRRKSQGQEEEEGRRRRRRERERESKKEER